MDVVFLAVSVVLTTYIPRQCLPAAGGLMTTTTTKISQSNMEYDDPKAFFSSKSNISNHHRRKNRSSNSSSNVLFTVSLGLSLLLFALNMLELFPQSWLLWVTTTGSTTPVTFGKTDIASSARITDLYRIVLWIITIHCMILLPSAMGIQILTMVFNPNYATSGSISISNNQDDAKADENSNSDRTDNDDDRKKRNFLKLQSEKKRHWLIRILVYVISTLTKTIVSTLTSYIFYPLHRMIQYYMIIPIQHKFQWCCYCRNSLLPTTTTSRRRMARTQNYGTIKLWFSNTLFVRCWYDSKIRKSIVYGSSIGISVSGVTLMFICPFVIELQEGKEGTDDLLLNCISCLCAVGIVLSTILNGFGSISLPYTCIAGLFVEPIPSNIIIKAEAELDQLHVNLNNKIQDLATATINDTTTVLIGSANINEVAQPKRSSSFWMMTQKKGGVRRNFSDFTSDATAQQRQKANALISELEFLETLISDTTNNLEEMRYTQSISYDARTTMGKIRSYMGILFSMILLSRLAAALSNVGKHYFTEGILLSFWLQVTPRNETDVDPVTRIVLWLSGHQVATTESIRTISQCVALSLTAVLSISQIRVFVRTITTIQRRLNNFYRKCYCQPFRFGRNDTVNTRNRHRKMKLSSSFNSETIASYLSLQQNQHPCSSSMIEKDGSSDNIPDDNVWFLSHPISFLLCCYCLACIVLTKMMLPIEYRTNFSNAILRITPPSTITDIHPMTNTIFTIRTYTIDVLYTITALISGTILAISLSFMRSNVRRIQLYSNITEHNDSSNSNQSPSFRTTSLSTI